MVDYEKQIGLFEKGIKIKKWHKTTFNFTKKTFLKDQEGFYFQVQK